MNKDNQPAPIESRLIPYCDKVITAALLAIIVAVPLYFDVHLYSVFDLSKITILYILTFAILAAWVYKDHFSIFISTTPMQFQPEFTIKVTPIKFTDSNFPVCQVGFQLSLP